MFTDRVLLTLSAGKGGDGLVSWKREKYIPKGGPSGGNGGPGGAIILKTSADVPCLAAWHSRRKIKGNNGRPGGVNLKQGKTGKDLVMHLPCGIVVKDGVTGEVLAELVDEGQEYPVCQGGRGGRGNASFKSSKHRAPCFSTKGKEGEEKQIELELKLIADVGLVGFPNAGKSTFIHRVAKVPVRIAPYPFTTLRPHLGYLESVDYHRLLIADIPGIIEGASENKGLGLKFLRHIERTKVLAFLLDASGMEGRSPAQDYRVLRNELARYDKSLLDRPFVVFLNKLDLPQAQEEVDAFYRENLVDRGSVYEISALKTDGLREVCEKLFEMVCAPSLAH